MVPAVADDHSSSGTSPLVAREPFRHLWPCATGAMVDGYHPQHTYATGQLVWPER